MLFIYNVITTCAFLLFIPFILVQLLTKKNRGQWLYRLGFLGPLPQGRYAWIHCASVGEVKVASLFISEFCKRMPQYKVILSVVTVSGFKVAVNSVPEATKVIFVPMDIAFLVKRAMKRVSPEMLILVETELWPNLIKYADKLNAKIITINGRISDRTFALYKVYRFIIKRIVRRVDLFLMREQYDYDRIIMLGADASKVNIMGNIKYDIIVSDNIKKYSVEKEYFGFSGADRIFVAGSIREGEEELVIDAYVDILKKHKDVKLIFSPRHLDRLELAEQLMDERNILHVRKTLNSEMKDFQCLLIDTYGELMKAYFVADIVFVGGSLIPLGGQNMIEPASLGKMVLFGPHTESFKEPAQMLVANYAAIRVQDAEQMKKTVIDYFSSPLKYEQYPVNAKNSIGKLQGVTARTVDKIEQFLKN